MISETSPLLSRRHLLAGLTSVVFFTADHPSTAAESPHVFNYEDDFDELWQTLKERYAFFSEKATDWNRVRSLYRPQAIAAPNISAFTDVIRRTLWELYDSHNAVINLPPGTPHYPPADLLAIQRRSGVIITAVEPDSSASRAGLSIGDRILAIDGVPIAKRVADLMPRCLTHLDPAATTYAVNAAIAGLRKRPRRFLLQSSSGAERGVIVPEESTATTSDVEWRMLDHGIGYIAIRSFTNQEVIGNFNQALQLFRHTRGLIVDVSDNGGGDTAVARPIMGRFISQPKPYATMRRREGKGLSAPWTEWVEPTGPFTYTQPVVVLCSHWSGSMAEGFPMGMRDIGRATLVGTPMMGLGAAVYEFRLDRTGLTGQYSAEPVYDIHGDPRWKLRPDIEVADGASLVDVGVETLLQSAKTPRFSSLGKSANTGPLSLRDRANDRLPPFSADGEVRC